jgi:hypothetical protein
MTAKSVVQDTPLLGGKAKDGNRNENEESIVFSRMLPNWDFKASIQTSKLAII